MASPSCEKAVEEALQHGRAILKFISANDTGKTGSHQCGYYLPKRLWKLYSPHPPTKGVNHDHNVTVEWWPLGRRTRSCVKWYGKGTRSEYRLTRFGHDFPYLAYDSVGDLLVLVPRGETEFGAFVLSEEEDFDEIQAQLGVEIVQFWGAYIAGAPPIETDGAQIDRALRQFAESVSEFPTTAAIAAQTQRVLFTCIAGFDRLDPDTALLKLLDTEYALFRLIERQLCTPEIARLFRSVDDFLKTANSILKRRKSRAGRSMELHCQYLLSQAGVPFEAQPAIDGEPDIIIPNVAAYHDQSFPDEKIFVLAVKRTCKDRWRQVTKEAKRIATKYIITIQNGISLTRLQLIEESGLTLVVPKPLHREYPSEFRPKLLSIRAFIDRVRVALAG
jgi:type II restriction enzyme